MESVEPERLSRAAVRVAPRDVSDPDLAALVVEAVADLDARYPEDAHVGRPIDPAATFLAATDAATGELLGCGALARVADDGDGDRVGGGTVEIKRMYVPPAARGRGVATRLLEALEALAAEWGARRIKLGTGRRQPEAMALYEKHGYRPIPVYGIYATHPASVCYAKELTA